jgi:TonB family protein
MIKPRICLTLTALALLGATSAFAQARFATLPTADDMAQAYPPKAAAEQVAGHATVSCAVTPDAGLANCSVKSETPAGYGFGAAALALTPKITLSPVNLPPTIDIPLRFEPPMRTTQAIFGKIPGGYAELGPAGPYYPERAMRLNKQGYAVLACHLAKTGRLSDCTVVDEAPADFGFRYAALKLVERRLLTAAPRLVDGVPLEDEIVQVVVPFQFRR